MFWIAPRWRRGALWYQSSLNARSVAGLASPFGKTSGKVSSCGASNFSGSLRSFARQLVARGERAAGEHGPAQLRAGGRGVEPGGGVAVGVVGAVGEQGRAARRGRGCGRCRRRSRPTRCGAAGRPPSTITPVRPMPPTVAQNSSASGPSGVSVRTSPSAVDQVHRQHVVAEAALGVVVLAVHVRADRAADRDLAGARQHRHPPAERQGGAHQGVEADPAVDDRDARVGVDRGRAGEAGHVQDGAAGVLRGVAVGAAEAAGDDPARPGGP